MYLLLILAPQKSYSPELPETRFFDICSDLDFGIDNKILTRGWQAFKWSVTPPTFSCLRRWHAFLNSTIIIKFLVSEGDTRFRFFPQTTDITEIGSPEYKRLRRNKQWVGVLQRQTLLPLGFSLICLCVFPGFPAAFSEAAGASYLKYHKLM